MPNYSNTPPDDDDATRIYRPYGSPPPDPDEASASVPEAAPEAPPDAPDGPPAESEPDPFSPNWTPDPHTPDPYAPVSRGDAPDPFGAPPEPLPDPFRPPVVEASDPFRPTGDTPPSPPFDPFHAQTPAEGPSPFGAPLAPDPFQAHPTHSAPDPIEAPPPVPPPHAGFPALAATAVPDPFAPAAQDIFAPRSRTPFPPPTQNPFEPSIPDAQPPQRSEPIHESFAPPPSASTPADPFVPPRAPDPFVPPSAPGPFVPAQPPPARPDPFAPPSSDPFAGAAPRSSPAPDPFQASGGDPFQTASRDPFQASAPDPFDLGPRRSAPAPRAAPAAAVPVPAGEGRLADAFASVFALILQLRSTSDFGDPASLRERAEALLDRAVAQARATGADPVDVREAEFGLVAFLDEAVLTSEWAGRDGWAAHPLQLSRYDRYDAGEAFFDRLRQLMTEGGRDEVLEVYYLCIALGYKGRYQIHGREVLGQLVEDLKGRLARAPGGRERPLAPHALARSPVATVQAGGFPTWALFAGAALLVVLLYVALSVSVSSVARDVATDVRAIPVSGAAR